MFDQVLNTPLQAATKGLVKWKTKAWEIFITLAISVWHRQILLYITLFSVRLRKVLNTSQRSVSKNSLTWWYVLKTSWRHLCKKCWRCLEDVSARHLEDVLKTSWRHLGMASWKRLEDIWPRKTYWSWPRRLEDVFWRGITKANIFVLIKRSWRHHLKAKTKDVFKMSSTHLHQDKCLLG